MFKKKREESGIVDSVIGSNTSINGTITFENGLRIDGNFEGEIKGVGGLIVGQSGVVKADLDVVDLFIGGIVEGNVNARGRVQISASGRLIGNISASAMMVEDGGLFEGTSRRASSSEEML